MHKDGNYTGEKFGEEVSIVASELLNKVSSTMVLRVSRNTFEHHGKPVLIDDSSGELVFEFPEHWTNEMISVAVDFAECILSLNAFPVLEG